MFVILSAHFLWKAHSIMTGIVILSASEGSRRHPRRCEILPPYGRQNDKRVKDNPSLVIQRYIGSVFLLPQDKISLRKYCK
ncbi:hypothetical protein Bacsa_2743 [Phocaeicola salanitronis DSM 18170]|uniref:Uncharacterized protein n=1 Tax=Phocaeicola salanitronis (strain DSM 18170 / JCM 13657 / CCUG 60908 / BL78) TaxID=667015 RepID=F0R0D2_PHOSB|nr:hypothetical protein Bacsa_2743 [Phocaeicola salanitronis DSM 18170]